jgi:hypothetical protein
VFFSSLFLQGSEIGKVMGSCMKARSMDERKAALVMHYVYDILE